MDKDPWNVPVTAATIPDTGLHMEIEAPPETRAQIATLVNVREVPRLSAVFDLTRRGTGVHVAGRVSALVGQTCVVSLEPMETLVDEVVDLLFVPPPAGAEHAGSEVVVSPGENDPPEPLIGGKINLGAVAIEFLVLGIDPYPRKPDAEFAAPKIEDAAPNPFAALEALKKRPGGGQT
jgi:uncharacterized metal-binding protein YceD (DUF177 family)